MFFGSWSAHMRSWLAAAETDPRVLIISYEALRADPRALIAKVNAHCGFGLSEARLDALLPRFTFAWMRQHEAIFEPRSVKWVQPALGDTDAISGAKRAPDTESETVTTTKGDDDEAPPKDDKLFHFIRAGRVGDGDEVFARPKARAALRKMVERTFGTSGPPAAVAALLPE